MLSVFGNAHILIRFIVGYVFLLAGMMKGLGLLSFNELPVPWSEGFVYVVGATEIICGSLILFNMHVRKAVIPLLVVMVGAITLTKISILFESGIWVMAHEARLDMIMFILLIYLWVKVPDTHQT